MIVQIYEVTTPAEARALGAMGVDHIGVLVGDGSFPREQTIEKAREIFAAIAHNTREILLTPDSPLLRQGESGFNFRSVRTDHSRATGVGYQNTPARVLPTQYQSFGDGNGTLGGDSNGPVYVSLDSPLVQLPDGTAQIDRLGTSNVTPLLVSGQINPALTQNHIRVIKNTRGKTSQLSQADIDAACPLSEVTPVTHVDLACF